MTATDKIIVNSKCRTEWLTLIDEWVHHKTEREMLKKYLLDGESIEEVAEELNLSAVQTQKRLKKAKAQLFGHI